MKITPSQLTISQLLSSKNEQFFIPAYQRRYAWGDIQLAELFEDINLLDEKDSHFLGTVLLLTEPHKANINMLEVVDGQQRIITLSLLLESIRDRFIELEKKEIADEIEGFLCCQGLDRKKQNKITLGDLDEPDYSKVLKLKNETDETGIAEIKNQKLLNAYQQFKKWTGRFDFNQLNEYYFKLINNVIFIRLDTEKAKDAYKLFETINNRGLRLSPTDIIKNFLLGHASLLSASTLIEVKDSWKDLIVALDGIETDDFFRQFLMGMLNRKIPNSKLISEFKKYYLTTVEEATCLPEYRLLKEFVGYDVSGESLQDEDDKNNVSVADAPKELLEDKKAKVSIVKFAKSLKNSAILYAKIINRNFDDKIINRNILGLQRIESTTTYTFLLRFFEKAGDLTEITTVLKILQSFMLRRHICEYRTSELDDIFSKLADVQRTDVIKWLKDNLKEHFPSDDEFREKIFKHSFKREEERAKYILEQFEYDLIGDQGEYVLNSGNELHLEHIIPQTIDTKKSFKEYGDWIGYLGKDALLKHEQYVDRIGNYTLLGQKLNIKASNNPFRAKKKEYVKSNIQLTLQLTKEFSRFKFKQVEERSKKFSEKAVNLWTI